MSSSMFRRRRPIRVLDEYETLRRLRQGASICRYGDGEFRCCRRRGIRFQQHRGTLTRRLRQILRSPEDPRILVGIPNVYQSTDHLNPDWTRLALWRRLSRRSARFLDPDREYASSFITRPETCAGLLTDGFFESFREVWSDRDVVFLGNCGRVTAADGTPVPFSHEEIVAHTLFSNAAGIRCIAAPKTNAFDQYDALLSRCLECHEHELILISLGPTATVLAFDLAIQGRQVIDFGQILMIYEFFRSGATRRPT